MVDDLSHKDSYLVQSRIPEYVSSFTPLCRDCSRVLITEEKEETAVSEWLPFHLQSLVSKQARAKPTSNVFKTAKRRSLGTETIFIHLSAKWGKANAFLYKRTKIKHNYPKADHPFPSL